MAYPRKLTDEQRAACRQEYETTPISLVKLARKYGMTDSSLREWVRREKWVRCAEQPLPVRKEAKAAEHEALITGARVSGAKKPAVQDSTQGGTLKACADGGPHAEGASAAAKSAQILNFPRDLKPLGEFRPRFAAATQQGRA